uniref:Uncharacterized protein n=1 Tax=Plectus sambesii TaxID=2011161 RepID=A0A914UIG1_9BILA
MPPRPNPACVALRPSSRRLAPCTTNDVDSDFEQNVSRLCQYLSESGDEDEATDEASSSSQATAPPHNMKEREQQRSQQQRPSTGPYYQRTARPVLPAAIVTALATPLNRTVANPSSLSAVLVDRLGQAVDRRII